MFTVGSLFSGIGGELGLEQAGMEIAWQCEKDKLCRQVLERWWPNVPRYGDIRTVVPDVLPRVDLICCGFPCQDLSVANSKRRGLVGERSGLFWDALRILTDCRPTWLLIENVSGLLSSNRGRDMATVLGALGDCGYGWAYRVLDSQFFGVPQRRRRVYIVGHSGGDYKRPAKVLFEQEGLPRSSQKGGKAGQDVAYSLRASPSHSGDKGDGGVNTTLVVEPYNIIGSAQVGRNHAYPSTVTGALQTKGNNASGNEAGTVISIRRAQTGSNGWGILEDGTTHSLDTSGGDRVMSMQGIRRLTPLECERLQGFPDGWTEGLSDTQRYKALGNAWTVPVIRSLGSRILDVEGR